MLTLLDWKNIDFLKEVSECFFAIVFPQKNILNGAIAAVDFYTLIQVEENQDCFHSSYVFSHHLDASTIQQCYY